MNELGTSQHIHIAATARSPIPLSVLMCARYRRIRGYGSRADNHQDGATSGRRDHRAPVHGNRARRSAHEASARARARAAARGGTISRGDRVCAQPAGRADRLRTGRRRHAGRRAHRARFDRCSLVLARPTRPRRRTRRRAPHEAVRSAFDPARDERVVGSDPLRPLRARALVVDPCHTSELIPTRSLPLGSSPAAIFRAARSLRLRTPGTGRREADNPPPASSKRKVMTPGS